ncbi:MAG: cyclic nucleotide-binding domain-containing protein [Verrucomicrobiota bacterium]
MASLADDLKRVPLFSELNQRQLRQLARHFKERTFRPGADIVRENQMSGVDFFVIVDGEARVTVRGREVAKLGPGAHFGELALIGERKRLSTVTAVTAVRCLAMASWHFRRFVTNNPDVSWKLLQHLVNLLSVELSKSP